MEKENTTQSSLLPWEAEGSEIRCSLMLLQGHKEPGPGALLSHTSHPPHNAGAISVVAACSSPLARRVLVFRHRAWKGPSDLPLLSIHTQALAGSKAKYPHLQTTFLTSPTPLNAVGCWCRHREMRSNPAEPAVSQSA